MALVGGGGGGGAIMVKKHLNPAEGPQIETEMLLVSIASIDKVAWTLGACYRPEVDQDQILDRICCAINNIDTQNVILMGDCNFNNLLLQHIGPCVGGEPLSSRKVRGWGGFWK